MHFIEDFIIQFAISFFRGLISVGGFLVTIQAIVVGFFLTGIVLTVVAAGLVGIKTLLLG